MALESVGSAIASSIFEALFDKLTSAETIDYFRKKCNDENLHSRLRTTLFSINAVADDAEQKQVSNLRVKKWLLEVKDVVLDAQDLVEEIQVQVLEPRRLIPALDITVKTSLPTITTNRKMLKNRLAASDEY